jgi:endonuclease/exonuclease/phosphatase family metal-dependent hydrolase
MINSDAAELRLGTFNYKRGGWSEDRRRHDFSGLLATLNQAPLPHVLALGEATMYHEFDEAPLWELVNAVNCLSVTGEVYYPFLSQRVGSRNHPLLLVAASVVTPKTWKLPGRNVRAAREHLLTAKIFGREVTLGSVHVDGGSGPVAVAAQAYRMAELVTQPTFLLGDFNRTSSVDGEHVPEDWHELMKDAPHKRAQKGVLGADDRWYVDTHPIDYMLQSGFVDAGQEAGDFTVTTNESVARAALRIDRIMWSKATRARLVPGSYHVFVPPRSAVFSDHRYVVASVTFD